MLLALIMGFSLMGGVGSVSLAGLFLLFPDKTRQVFVTCLVSYATGTLLGAAFLGLIPRALNRIPASSALSVVLGGIILFLILEKVVIWRHCHHESCDTHGTAGPLILIGDAFHNFVDGAVIAATFVTSIPLGIATSLAVISHEIPQELGDFAILLESGYKKRQAFLYNIISSLSSVFGAALAYLFLLEVHVVIGYVMLISASGFIYIAIADLIPSLHRHTSVKHSVFQLALILGGIGTIVVFHLGD